MFWLLLVFMAHADLSGTWKVREPVVFEMTFETCEFRGVVAHVIQIGDKISGNYEAQVSCTERHWPDARWRTRVGTLEGTVDGERFSIAIDDLGIFLEGTTDGAAITGTVGDEDGAAQRWSAHRVAH